MPDNTHAQGVPYRRYLSHTTYSIRHTGDEGGQMNTRNTFRKSTALAMGILTATAITAACGTDDTDTPAITTSAQPVLNGPEGSQKAPEQQASEAAIAKVNEFYAVRGALDADPAQPVERLTTVAGDPVLGKYTGDITLRRSQGVASTGQISVVNSKVTDLDAPKDAEGSPIAGPAWVHVEACTDITTWNSVHADGSSAMDPNRGTYERVKFTVRNAEWPDANGWRVTSQTVEKTDSCNT